MTALLQSIALVLLSIGLIVTNLRVVRLLRRLRVVTQALVDTHRQVASLAARDLAGPR